MAYQLDELYEAIAKAKRTIGNYEMAGETEFCTGSVCFYNKYMSNGNVSVGKYTQIYATPA